ncbi:glycosyltransferase family 2 protein [Noviherbaspirillum sp. ST9]|uniref:glycosyltransferase family 2 protein n=1 Tax=Noviherbaspirillum sp. ST9 TaxID=3401606 RepID=UPI003B58AC05
MDRNPERPKVSVCVVTYNQENYIRQCLQSIVDQETDFDYEVIVGDDCSTDGTTAIVREFGERYPGKVRAILREKNIGPTQNYLDVHNLARGEYVAHVDGDDYCLPGKLNVLAAHLDREPGCAIVWHRMIILNEHGQSAVGMPIVPIRTFTNSNRLYAKDLAKYYGLTGCHSGSMYRASERRFRGREEETIDYFSTLAFCIRGNYASYIEEPYGVYRFYTNEITVTKVKGAVITGRCKLNLMHSYLQTNPELADAFAAQCLFELLLRTYLRYPLKWQFFKMFLACRTMPSLSDMALITKVFMANRNTKLRRAFMNSSTVRAFV